MKTFASLQETPKNYFSLMEKVGCEGRYQALIFAILSLNWFVSAMLLMGTSLLYLNPSLVCPASLSLSQMECKQYVCSKPQKQWGLYVGPKLAESLSTQYGPYQCSNEITLNYLRSMLYVGVFFGYMIFLFFADNLGRKFSLVLTWGVTTFGLVLLSASWSMTIAAIGLFLAGAGCESAIRISMSLLTQVVEFNLRQKFSVALQSTFGISGVLIGVLFYLIQEWRIIIIFFCLFPSILVLFLLITQLQETPKYLLKKGAYKTLQALNRIARINRVQQQLVYEDIQSYIQRQPEDQKYIQIIDFFIYPVLRMKTILISLIFFALTYAYIGPIIIVDKLGYSPFRSQAIISAAEITVYPITFCIIHLLPRKRSGKFLMSLASIFTGILIFVKKPQVCHHCFQGNMEIVMMFCARFCVAMYFSVFFIYCTELFPLPARTLGFGIGSSAGALASTSGQVIMPFIEQMGWNPMILLTGMTLISMILVQFLPETLNMPLEEELDLFANQDKGVRHSKENYEQIEKKNGQWTFHNSITEESGIMAKRAKINFEGFLRLFFPNFRGFQRLQGHEQI